MTGWIKDFIAGSWFYTPLRRLTRRVAGIPVLMYHSIGDENDPFFPSLPVKVFENQIRYFSQSYGIISLERLTEYLESGEIPPDGLVITFDDGYRDTFTRAWPILKRYGATATTFLATGSIGRGKPIWTDELAQMIKVTVVKNLELPGLKDFRSFPLQTLEERLTVLRLIKKEFKKLPAEKRVLLMEDLRKKLRVDGTRGIEERMLHWEEVLQLSQEGMDFGGHTVTHPILKTLPDELIFSEMRDSKKEIENRLQKEVLTFAYPNGTEDDFDMRAQKIAREIGFRCACSTISGFSQKGSDLYAIPRIYTTVLSLPRFAWTLSHVAVPS